MSETEPRKRGRKAREALIKASNEGIGNLQTFAAYLRANRALHNETLEERAKATGLIDQSTLSRLEKASGNVPIPARPTIIHYMNTWNLPKDEADELIVAAGYLPEIPVHTRNDILLLAAAIRELISPEDTPQGFIKIFQERMKSLDK